MRIWYPRFQQFTDEIGDGGGGGPVTPPSPSPTPSGGSPAPTPAPAPGPAAGGQGTPPTGVPPAGAPPVSAFSYPEDRSTWVPPQRLQTVAQRVAQAEHRANQLQAMIEAGTGVRLPQAAQPVDPEIAQAREAFEQVFGQGAGRLFEGGRIERLVAISDAMDRLNITDPAELFGAIPQLQSSEEQRWAQHGTQVLGAVFAGVAQDFGTQQLAPRQQQAIGRDFQQWLESDQSQQRIHRYMRADPTLTEEYLGEYREHFVAPFRRTQQAGAIAGAARRAGLPPAPQSGGMPPPGAPAAPKNAEQVHDDAWRAFSAMGAGR